MRLDKPVGIWLLLWPCWWSISLSFQGDIKDHLILLAWFAAGAIIMRSAGCVVNDLADRRFDAEVARTRTRPLASGELNPSDAVIILIFLLSIALFIALQLHHAVIMWAAVSLVLVGAYPFMKRITYWPQAFLGLTFNSGALLGWVATSGAPSATAWLIYAAGLCWTIGYDTLYAHQDIEDDLRIGVKSTAIAFGRHSKFLILMFYLVSCLFFLMALHAQTNWLAKFGPSLLMAGFGLWLTATTPLGQPAACLRAFKANILLGGLIWLCFLPIF